MGEELSLSIQRLYISLGKALKDKYATPSEEDVDIITIGPTEGQKVTVELVGKAQVEEQLRDLAQLACASLQDALVSGLHTS